MNRETYQMVVKGGRLGLAVLGGIILLAVVVLALKINTFEVQADPIAPEDGGYPKFNTSIKMVTPTLAHTGGVTLYYTIELHNTGAWEALTTTLTDVLPSYVTYLDDLQASVPFSLDVVTGTLTTLTWQGDVGFDSTAVITYSVWVDASYSGTVTNTAIISHGLVAHPVTMTAVTVVTDDPILTIEKSSTPEKPGAGKPLTYTLAVANEGQPVPMYITVTDRVPLNTTLRGIGQGGYSGTISNVVVVTWTQNITLETGETTFFDFSVDVGPVPSGTVITNADYQVASSAAELAVGEPYTVTVIDPIFHLFKEVWPNPPGSNREMTYTLSVLNTGSLATGLVITDVVPAGVEYRRGGSLGPGDIISWTYPSLDTGELAEFTFTAYISDVMDLPIVNDDYAVCATVEEVCQAGDVLTSVVQGPVFEATAIVDPIAHKPGGGEGTAVTPTLIVRNVGNGNALDAMAILYYDRIKFKDLYAIPPIGTPPPFPGGPECGDKCRSYVWVGDIGHGETVTFTVKEAQNTVGGAEGTHYTTTVVITDAMSNMTTVPVSDTAIGLVTHYAHVIPDKSAPPVIGPGQVLTYVIQANNWGLSTDEHPVLTDVVPISTTFLRASDGGMTQTISDTVIVSWTLPLLSPGDGVVRTFSVLVDDDLVSGTEIINNDYSVLGYGNIVTDAMSSGPPVTTTVKEVGLIHSFKEVTPTVVSPGSGIVLTYALHIVNSSGLSLTDVTVEDLLPWQASTYQRDAVASAGDVVSDIVSFHWTGDVAAFSSEVVTVTVLVDEDFEGPITNTAVISHADLREEVVVEAVAYVTDEPVLEISKRASPDPVKRGEELTYKITVVNRGQRATNLLVTDTIPAGTAYVPGSAANSGQLVDDGQVLQWEFGELLPGASSTFEFRVTAEKNNQITNERYGVICEEGVTAMGLPVTTDVSGGIIYLPLVLKR